MNDVLLLRFERQVARCPGATAVWTPRLQLTYEQLNREANLIAHDLLGRAGSGAEPVGVLCEQGIPAVMAILGILKAGRCFLPIDPSHPEERVRDILADAGVRWVVASREFIDFGKRLCPEGGGILCPAGAKAGLSDANPGVAVSPDHPASLFYTSGSTGRPKGVVDSHRNVVHNILRYTNALRILPSDRLSLIQSPAFSGTVSSLFAALLNGATVCPFNLRREGFSAMAAWIPEAGITVYHSVPSILRGVVEGGRRFPGVRVVRLEGDRVRAEDVAAVRGAFAPECLLAVGLGATETGLSCQYRVTVAESPAEGPVPIGRPTEDMELSLRDDDGHPVPAGKVGEIAVRSRFLAVGYWRQEEWTRRRFRSETGDPGVRTYFTGDLGRWREDGLLEYVGRRDGFAKIRGQRVEPSEVETALLRVPGLRQAAVVIREDRPGDPWLVAYYGVLPGVSRTPAELRAALAAVLPDAMVPSRFIPLEVFPLGEHGKVDRSALQLRPLSPEAELPGSGSGDGDELELRIAGLWREVLQSGPVPLEVSFPDLGGESLSGARLCQRLERAFGIRVPPHVLVCHPTVRQLAVWIRGGGNLDATFVVPLRGGEDGTPLFFVHDLHGSVSTYGPLVRHLAPGWRCLALAPVTNPYGPDAPRTIGELAARHLESIRSLELRGPIHLIGHCFAAVVVLEMVRQLESQGTKVGFVGMVGISPFDFPRLVLPWCLRRYRMMNRRRGMRGQQQYLKARLERLSLLEKVRFLRFRGGQFGSFLLRRLRHGPDPTPAEELPPVAAYHRTLFRRHRARPVSAEVDLFLPTGSTMLYTSDPGADFYELSRSRVTVHPTPGTDWTILSDPSARDLANRIGACLSRFPHRP